MFVTGKTASFASETAHGVEEPPRRPGPRDRLEPLYVFAIWHQKHRNRKSFDIAVPI